MDPSSSNIYLMEKQKNLKKVLMIKYTQVKILQHLKPSSSNIWSWLSVFGRENYLFSCIGDPWMRKRESEKRRGSWVKSKTRIYTRRSRNHRRDKREERLKTNIKLLPTSKSKDSKVSMDVDSDPAMQCHDVSLKFLYGKSGLILWQIELFLSFFVSTCS